DLAAWLSGTGHDVTVLTTHRGPTSAADEDGFRVLRVRRPPDVFFERRAYEDYLGATASQALGVVRGEFDVAQAFSPVSGWAALLGRDFGGPPVVYSNMGIPTRRYLVEARYRMAMHVELARHAARCT